MTYRPLMTSLLAEALDAMTAQQRHILTVIADESAHDWLKALLLGLRAESMAVECRRNAVLAAHEADRVADIEAIDAEADWSHVPEPEPRTESYWPETDSPA